MREICSASLVFILAGMLLVQLPAQSAVRTGEITSIDVAAKTFVVKTSRGDTTVQVADHTVIKEGEKTLQLSDLKVGDQVKVTGERTEKGVDAHEVLKQAKESEAM
ncbi:MAG: hypothetical protein HY645_07285 [Acidobacteria bacterium]|nr:hypothetical protein [Acidobacteriota bacterium]